MPPCFCWLHKSRVIAPERQQIPVVNAASVVKAGIKAVPDKALATYEQSIIQMLDRWVPDEQTGMYFKADAFPDTVDLWNGIELVFANEHPDLDLFEKDPQAALDKVKGRIVGQCLDTRYITEGHPHLRSALEVTDKECVDLWNAGKLSLSTAFWATVDDTDVIGDIKPNHVLLFAEDAANQPKDKGTLIQKGTRMTAEPTKMASTNAGRVISSSNAQEFGGLLTALSAFLSRLKGEEASSSIPGIVGDVEVAGDIDPCVTDDPKDTSVMAADLITIPATPTAPASNPIQPPGASLPGPTIAPKQNDNYATAVAGEYLPARNKTDQVDTMTAETEALISKVATVQAELANKDVVIKEKDANIASLTAQLSQKEADFKIAGDILAEKDTVIANKDIEIKAAADQLAALAQKENDAKFDAIVASLPAGQTNKAEDVAALKVLSSDPLAFAQKVIEMANSVKVPVTKEEGKTIVPATGVANMTKRTLGKYNMMTHKWEDTQ